MLLRALDGLSVVQHGLLKLGHQPGEITHRGHVVVPAERGLSEERNSQTKTVLNSLHAGRSVSSLHADVNIDQLLPAALLQLIQLQSGKHLIVSISVNLSEVWENDSRDYVSIQIPADSAGK